MGYPALCRYYYSTNKYPTNFISIPITRWDENGDEIIIETFVGSGNRDTIFKNMVPQSYRQLYNILGVKKFIDTTYSSSNTIILEPISGYGLSGLRQRRKFAVKSASDSIITPNTFGIKIEGIILD